MKIKIKLFIATLMIIGVIIIFNSCKKTATNEPNPQSELLKQFKKKYQNEPFSSTQILNLPGKGYYGDINGNRINIVPGQSNRGNATSCPEPGDSEFDQELVSIVRELTCGFGYRLTVTYKITSEFYPQLTNGSGLPSKGRIKLLNSSGTQVYISPSSPANPVINIQNNGVVGQNSNGDDLNEFLVTYRSEFVPTAIYDQSASVQSNLFCYTDCANYASLSIGFSTQQSSLNSANNSLPCNRIDKVYWNTSTGLGASTGGCNYIPSSCFPYGYVFPDKQEIEIYLGSGWTALRLWRYASGGGTENVTDGLISPIDVWYIDMTNYPGVGNISNGNYNIRYRNKETDTSNGGPCETQPSNTWVTESWYISI